MTIKELIKKIYNQTNNYPYTVVTVYKHFNYQITPKQIRRELNKIVNSQ